MTKSRHEWAGPGEESGQPGVMIRGQSAASLIDDEGVPATLPVSEWLGLPDSGILPDSVPMTRWLLAVLRYSRADGSPVFEPRGRSSGRLKALGGWTERLGDPSPGRRARPMAPLPVGVEPAPVAASPVLGRPARPPAGDPPARLVAPRGPRGDRPPTARRPDARRGLFPRADLDRSDLDRLADRGQVRPGRANLLDVEPLRRRRRMVVPRGQVAGDPLRRAPPRPEHGPARPADRRRTLG